MSGKSGIQDKAFGLGLEARAQGGLEGVPNVEVISFVLELSCWSQIGSAVCHVRLRAGRAATTLES